ncbi:MAG: type I restriction endonuclease [Ginsengibacter sp.]
MPINEGYISACERAYNLITLGKAFEQNIDGDKKSFTLQYIDWKNVDNNVFHVTEGYSVMRSTSKEHYRRDLILFVNGIPLIIIECKRPEIKDPLAQAISQQLRSQQEDGIRSLYVYAQVLLSLSCNHALYAINGTHEKFRAKWQEKFTATEEENQYRKTLQELKNKPLAIEQKTNCMKAGLNTYDTILMHWNRKTFYQPYRINIYMDCAVRNDCPILFAISHCLTTEKKRLRDTNSFFQLKNLCNALVKVKMAIILLMKCG